MVGPEEGVAADVGLGAGDTILGDGAADQMDLGLNSADLLLRRILDREVVSVGRDMLLGRRLISGVR